MENIHLKAVHFNYITHVSSLKTKGYFQVLVDSLYIYSCSHISSLNASHHRCFHHAISVECVSFAIKHLSVKNGMRKFLLNDANEQFNPLRIRIIHELHQQTEHSYSETFKHFCFLFIFTSTSLCAMFQRKMSRKFLIVIG